MRWLHNFSFSLSSSLNKPSHSSSSTSVDDTLSRSSVRGRHRSRNGSLRSAAASSGYRLENFFDRGPKLMRHRKHRHLSDHDFAGDVSEPVSVARSRSVSSSANSRSVAMPLPLPLPSRESSSSVDVDLPLSSALERDRDGGRERADLYLVGCSTVCAPSSNGSVHRDARKSTGNVETRSSKVRLSDSSDVEIYRDNSKVNLSHKSAPNSPFSSPLLSPERGSAAAATDYTPYINYIKANQAWSAPEMPTFDIAGLPPPAFFDFTAISDDSSPLHSPRNRSPHKNIRSPPMVASPNNRLSIDVPIQRREGFNPEFHPLPLPPGKSIHSPPPASSATPLSPNVLSKLELIQMKAHLSPSSISASAPAPATASPPALSPQVIVKTESMQMKSQWQKGKLIGRGTFGSVYIGTNRENGSLCAMKEVEMFPDDPKCAESIKQLQQEIKVLSNLKHQNIVQYFGSEIVDDKLYIYLEYVHPGSINKYIREHCGVMTESVVRSFTRHIVSGLAYLHSMKTIHRDIKGANLLVDAFGVVKLADFGMAKHLTGHSADLSLRGSPYWMAPELMQAVIRKDTNSDLALAIDIWSLGCTIIEMLTGKPPWSEYEGAAAMFKVLKDNPSIPESLSSDGKDFLHCCLQRNPADRLSATLLLEHRWLKTSQHLDPVPSSSLQSNNGTMSATNVINQRLR